MLHAKSLATNINVLPKVSVYASCCYVSMMVFSIIRSETKLKAICAKAAHFVTRYNSYCLVSHQETSFQHNALNSEVSELCMLDCM